MSDSRFTVRDGLALLLLLGVLSAMTIGLWLPLHFLTPIDASVSDIYVVSCVLLLIIHLIRRRVRASPTSDRPSKETNPS